MTIKKIESHGLDEHANSLSSYLPGGPLFAGARKQGTIFRNFIEGLAHELVRQEAYVKELQEEILPDKTNAFLTQWENALGIPDDCFSGDGTNEERRSHVLIKLASLGVQTLEDFQNLSDIFDVDATVVPASGFSTFPYVFPITFEDTGFTPEDARFVLIVEFPKNPSLVFPYTFPIEFGSVNIRILACLFLKLIPANCNIVFKGV